MRTQGEECTTRPAQQGGHGCGTGQGRLGPEGTPRVVEPVWVGETDVAPGSAYDRLAAQVSEEDSILLDYADRYT